MNAYFTVVLLAVILFYIVWGLGWFLERLSHQMLSVTQHPGSKAWYMLVGPGVALHESSHALGCVFTRTEIVEFKPINVSVQDDQIVLGYVRYRMPSSALKNAIINLAPVAVSLVLLTMFALGATYLVPGSPGIGGRTLDLLGELINLKANPTLLNDPLYPIVQIGDFVYLFLYTIAGLTVLSPIFWIVAFLAMTIMFSNAPSSTDIRNASRGLMVIMIFDLIWLVIAFLLPDAGWVLFGLFELLAVMFSLALAMAVVGYGFFILVIAMARLRTPLQIFPFLGAIGTGLALFYNAIGTAAFQTIFSIAVFVVVTLVLLAIKKARATT